MITEFENVADEHVVQHPASMSPLPCNHNPKKKPRKCNHWISQQYMLPHFEWNL
ncbi:hypothetical protein OIU77_028917 [Salix suchowensis]|uniref:Uncharacterized protein n=1 Tax=Salix suchowensis TaxID=1278906 RepID=A0ABQ9BJ30_9ROSI|nr:hypothetical protein OIU77_028917 [Salix suchowensis]